MPDRYRKGAHTIYDIKYHFVWKTKYGYGVLKRDLALRLRQIIREICKERRLEIVSGNVRPNHVHLLVSCPSDVAPSNEEMIKQYIENQDEKEGEFKVWDLEPKRTTEDLQPDNHPVQ